MTRRIFRSISAAAMAVLFACLALMLGALYAYFSQLQFRQLRAQTALAAQGVMHEGADYFQGLDAQIGRITWIDAQGNVLYDTQADASELENHLEREEIEQAFSTGYGQSARYSATLMQRQLYAAQRLQDGTVLRMAVGQSTIVTLLLGMLQPLCVIALLALALSLWLASRLAKAIVKPLNALNLDEPLSNEGYDELAPLLRRLDNQQWQLRRQADALKRAQDEFEAVADNMSEGLMLINAQGKILTMNKAAQALLRTDGRCTGENLLAVNRSLAVQEILQCLAEGKPAERILPFYGRKYQLRFSPVISQETLQGGVLLLFDATEREEAEQLRREFASNVSHELKTPLQAICGYAELLVNGMVPNEETSAFSGRIYQQAQRMINLVDDILRLSHLDAGAQDMAWEEVDVYALAQEAVRALSPQAAQAGVQIALSGGTARVWGISRLVSAIVYNLCENAVKYNRTGGSVQVAVEEEQGEVKLTVRDTGIGIAPQEQERIFERFYRVDKSRSQQVGGTGLGLSIVKHAAQIHGARVALKSAPGEGTEICVSFPKKKEP